MYVDSECLFALAKGADSMTEEANEALDRGEIYTSLLAYGEFLARVYEPGVGFDFDVPRLVANLLELVPIRPEADEEAVLRAAFYLDNHDTTPFDALQTEIATLRGERTLTTENARDKLDFERDS